MSPTPKLSSCKHWKPATPIINELIRCMCAYNERRPWSSNSAKRRGACRWAEWREIHNTDKIFTQRMEEAQNWWACASSSPSFADSVSWTGAFRPVYCIIECIASTHFRSRTPIFVTRYHPLLAVSEHTSDIYFGAPAPPESILLYLTRLYHAQDARWPRTSTFLPTAIVARALTPWTETFPLRLLHPSLVQAFCWAAPISSR